MQNTNKPQYNRMPVQSPETQERIRRVAGRARGAKKRRAAVRRKRTMMRVLTVVLIVALSLTGVYAWFNGTVGSILSTGEVGNLSSLYATTPEFKGDVVNILVLGIDYEEGRTSANTDLIMYVHYDIKNNKLNMLQIPRDTFVGTEGYSFKDSKTGETITVNTGGTGKINGLYVHGPDKENPVNNLVEVLYAEYRLPVDYYVSIDMDGLIELVDRFGPLEVYVAQALDYYNKDTGALEGHLDEGWQWLTGYQAEFFLRNRQSFADADLGRLVNQRYFYAALFKRLRTLAPADIVKFTPVIAYFCNTNMSITDVAGIGIKLLSLDNENITLARLPIKASEQYNANATICGSPAEDAELLNTYFRAEGEVVPASELNIPDYASYGEATDPQVSTMGGVVANETPQA